MNEQRVLALIESKEYELLAKGFTLDQSTAAIKRARKWSESIARKVRPELRDDTFISLFESSLDECESWISKSIQAMTI